jgi:DNA processing protein
MTYNNSEKLCILLSTLFVGATRKNNEILAHFGDLEGVKTALHNNSAALSRLLGDENVAVLSKAVNGNEIDGIIDRLLNHNVTCVTIVSDAFPDLLKNIPDVPINLFCIGDVNLLKTHCIAVIGTRKPSVYGKNAATQFSDALAKYFTIVSGLAYGIDSIAHECTLNVLGKTIAVLGGGFNHIYPAANTNLLERILKLGGLAVSEYPLDTEPKTYHFPQRNRVVAGLSRGLLVCQAPIKSGTTSTVNYALEQGRDVFVIPGEIYDYGFLGSNELIKQLQGAMVTTPTDIITKYIEAPDMVAAKKAIPLDNQSQAIVDLLSNERKHYNQLIAATKLAPVKLNVILSELELKGIVTKLSGNIYGLVGGN